MGRFGVIAVIAAAVVALGIWGLSDKRAPPAEPPAAAQGWTSASRAQLRDEVARHNEGSWPAFLTTEDARNQMLDCFVDKLVAAVPGGTAQWGRLAREGSRLQELTARAGFECGREYSVRVTSATAWSASFSPVFVAACVQHGGEVLRVGCACVAQGARARFSGPADFMGVFTAPRAKRSQADQKRLGEVIDQCERGEAVEALGEQGFAE